MSTTDTSAVSKDSANSDNYKTIEAEPYKNPDLLHDLHVIKRKTQREIADIFDVSQPTVKYWLDKFGIQKPERNFYRNIHVTDGDKEKDGRIFLHAAEGNNEPTISIHQITALEDFHVTEVFCDNSHVHHLMNCDWVVDLPENLEVLTHSEHIKQHAEGTAQHDPETILQHTFDEFEVGFGDSDDDDTDSDDPLTWKLSEGPPNHVLNPKTEVDE